MSAVVDEFKFLQFLVLTFRGRKAIPVLFKKIEQNLTNILKIGSKFGRVLAPQVQCDQIGRFIGLWATFESLWQQLICPNLLHSFCIIFWGIVINTTAYQLGRYSLHLLLL